MRKVILFIAMSLDGYIADYNGGVGWLKGQSEHDTIDPYSEFVQQVDTVIMGWNTYHQIVTELSPDEWVYSDLTSYVLTHKDIPSTEMIIFTQETPCMLVEKLRQEPGKDIWICGGADTVQQLMREGCIDLYYISVIPIILGNGIRLFGKNEKEIKLELVRTQTYNGIVDLIYQRRMIRRFQAEDLDRVMEIWLETNKKAHDFVPEAYWEDHYEMVKELLPQSELYVYENQDGDIQGFVGLDQDYIAGIFVCSTAQSKGIGSRLIRHVQALKSRLTLQVYQKNERAAAFYQREGFQIRRVGADEGTGETEYLMEWTKEAGKES